MFTQRNIKQALLFALLAIIAGLSVTYAEARSAPAPILTACPQGHALDDGCPGSSLIQQGQLASFQVGTTGPYAALSSCWSGGLGQIDGSTTVWTINPTTLSSTGTGTNTTNYNLAGCDFPVGAWTPVAQMASPVSGPGAWPTGWTSTIPGCTLNPTGNQYGAALFSCGGASLPKLIAGYDFGPTSTHPCLGIQFSGTGLTGNSYVWQNDHFENDGNCGAGAVGPSLFTTINYSNVAIAFLDDTFDGNGLTWSTFWGQCPPSPGVAGKACNAPQAMDLGQGAGSGNIDIERSVIMNFSGRGIFFGVANGANFVIKSSVLSGNDFRAASLHGETLQPSNPNTAGGQFISFTNWLQTTAMGSFSEAPWPSDFGSGSTILYGDHNVTMTAYSGDTHLSTGVSITIAAGTSTAHFTGVSGSLGNGAGVGGCTGSGASGSIAGATWTPKSGQAALAGGGWSSTAATQDWGFDVNTSAPTYAITGFIDDGSGGGSPAPAGHPGTILTVTTPGLINIAVDSVNGATITGSGVTSTTVLSANGGATGGSGTYNVSVSQQVGSETLNVSIPNLYDGGWTAQTNLTCSSLAPPFTSSLTWLDFDVNFSAYGPPPAGFLGPVQMTNNLIDDAAGANSHGFNQRTPLHPSSATFPVTGFIDDGLGGGSYDGVAGNTLTVTGANASWAVYANATMGAQITGGFTTATLTAFGTGSGGTGTYTMNGSAQAVAPGTINVQTAGCGGGPAVFSGNQSVAGTATNWNIWTTTLANTHC